MTYSSKEQIDIISRIQVEEMLDIVFPRYRDQHEWLSTFNEDFGHTPFWMLDNEKYEELFNFLKGKI
jgi:hypothetical protein